jgi:chromosome segregation ATPase
MIEHSSLRSQFNCNNQMKKSLLVFTTYAVMAATTLINCNSPARKNVEAQTEDEANQNDVPKAKEEYLTDIDSYRKEMDDKITANRRSIADLKSRIKDKDREAAANYKTQINDLEQKNNDLKKRMDEYTAEGKEKWDTFKNEFNHDMDELDRSLKDLTTKNTK